MKQLKRFKKWFNKTKVSELKNDKKLDNLKRKESGYKIENADVIQGGVQKDTANTTVDPQWPVTH